jgi:drug/metabolite transporter (DMT)-like permease
MHKRPSNNTHSESLRGLLAIALAAALWAIAAAAARGLFDRGVDPLEVAAARSVIAAAGLALIPAARARVAAGSVAAVIALGLSIAMVNAVYYQAIARLDVAVALVLQYTAPALVVGWLALRTRRPPPREVAAAVVVTFAGVVLVSGVIDSDVGDVSSAGVAFGLASSLFFATYTLLSERAGAAYGVLGALLRGFVAATIMWALFHIPRGWPSDLVAAENLPIVLFVGIVGTLAPFILFLWGVQKVRAERAAIAATLEPILAAVVAWLWLDQVLTPLQVAGGALILGGVLALQIRRREVDVPDL